MATSYNLSVDKNSNFSVDLRFVDSANNNLLVGAVSAQAQIREIPESEDRYADFTCVFSSNNNSLTLSLTPAQTANISVRTAFWDCKVVWPDRQEYIIKGKVIVNNTVTR